MLHSILSETVVIERGSFTFLCLTFLKLLQRFCGKTLLLSTQDCSKYSSDYVI